MQWSLLQLLRRRRGSRCDKNHAAKVRRKRQSVVTQIASKLSHFSENNIFMPDFDGTLSTEEVLEGDAAHVAEIVYEGGQVDAAILIFP
jgi:hypothetical protein